jgi:hypothetical protein
MLEGSAIPTIALLAALALVFPALTTLQMIDHAHRLAPIDARDQS